MKATRLTALFIILTLVSFLYCNTDFYPKTIIGNYIAASDNEHNNRAYTGIDRLTSDYGRGTFIPIRYYHSSINNELSSESVDRMLDEIEALTPGTMIVNNRRISKPELPLESGKPYEYLLMKEYYQPAPLHITIDSFNAETGQVAVTVTLLSHTQSFNETTIRYTLIEDDIAPDYTNIARYVKDEVFSLSGNQNSITLNSTVQVSNGYNRDNLYLAVSVIDEGKTIQSASTYEATDSYLRAVFTEKRIDIGPSSGLYEAEYFSVFYFGETAELSIRIDSDNLPQGWFISYCDDIGSCHFGPLNFSLADGEATKFHSNIFPADAGMMDYYFEVFSSALPEPYRIPVRYITADVDVLIIDGDGWSDYERFVIPSIEGISYGIWCTTMADIDEIVNKKNLIWIAGNREPALTQSETHFLREHLDSGNNLLISGQDIGYYLVDNDYYADPVFYTNYLNAELIDRNAANYDLTGVTNDVISDGISFTLNQQGSAQNQTSPSVIAVNNDQVGVEIFHYQDHTAAGVRSQFNDDIGKVVYLAFGVEGIADTNTRQNLISNTLIWFQVPTNITDTYKISSRQIELLPGFPNPLVLNSLSQNNTEYIRLPYFLPDGNKGTTLKVFNIKGQMIKSFDRLPVSNDKSGYILWDGHDSQGNKAANGIYLFILSTGQQQAVQKFSIVR